MIIIGAKVSFYMILCVMSAITAEHTWFPNFTNFLKLVK